MLGNSSDSPWHMRNLCALSNSLQQLFDADSFVMSNGSNTPQFAIMGFPSVITKIYVKFSCCDLRTLKQLSVFKKKLCRPTHAMYRYCLLFICYCLLILFNVQRVFLSLILQSFAFQVG